MKYFALVYAFMFATTCLAANEGAPFSLRIKTENLRIAPGAHVYLDIMLINSSLKTIMAPQDTAAFDYVFDVRDARGVKPPLAPLGRKLSDKSVVRVGRDIILPLKPKEIIQERIDLSTLYTFDAPGRYTVRVFRHVPQYLGHGVVKSNTLVLTVVPLMPRGHGDGR